MVDWNLNKSYLLPASMIYEHDIQCFEFVVSSPVLIPSYFLSLIS